MPIKIEGRYYAYFHGMYGKYNTPSAAIYRAYSYDLLEWVIEGVILDNRDTPSEPNKTSNADMCLIEFKGRTFMYYTYDINSGGKAPIIKILIDNRRCIDILKLRP